MNLPEGFEIDEDIRPPEGFEIDEPKSVMGAVKNLGTDVKDTLTGLGNLGKGLVTHPIDTALSVVSNIPRAIVDEGKRIGVGELITGHPINAAEKFGNALYEKPMTTVLDVLPVAGAAGKFMRGSKAAPAAEAVSKAVPLAEDAASVAKKVAPAVDNVSGPVGNVGNVVDNVIGSVTQKAKTAIKGPLDEVGDFLSSRYAKISQRPKWADTIADYAEQNARNMATKSSSASYGQLRKLGEETTRELQDIMLDRGIVSPKVGPIGAKKMVKGFQTTAGKTIGESREIAAKRGGIHNMPEVVDQIRSKLDQKYKSGMYSGQKGSYKKSLDELSKLNGTPDEVAKKISEMFRESKRQDPLKQPSGPLADVARELRTANEGLIKSKLSPEEALAYQNALNEYGAMTQIYEFYKRGDFRDASGRLGPGAGLTRQAIQSFFDMIGYRGQAQISKKFAEWIRKNPEAASNPSAMFEKYIDEAVEAIDDIGDIGQ